MRNSLILSKKGGDVMAETKTREIRISIPEELFSFFLPEKTLDHMLNAKKEMLLAFRSLIDARIETVEKMQKKQKTKSKKIKIE